MDQLNPAAEYLRIAEHYRQMKDEELLCLVPQRDELTPFAQQALASEVRQRGLKVDMKAEDTIPEKPSFAELKFSVVSPSDENPSNYSGGTEDTFEEERKLVELCTVWSQRDALKIQRILDVAGIPFFMGPEKATGVDAVTSNFANGVSVQIMRIGMPWAMPLMQSYEPQDDPSPPDNEIKEAPIRCPRCNSTDVVFDGLSTAIGAPGDNSSQKFRWTCDACGNRWADEGVGREE